jgi:ABC-type nickel/cobalt efflux system permease component RcnA
VEATIGATGVSMRSLTYGDYYKYSRTLEEYIRKTVSLRDKEWVLCTLGNFATQDLGVDDIFTRGFPVSYTATCQNAVDTFEYSVAIYRELPLQTNRVRILGNDGNSLSYRVLTARLVSAKYDPLNTTKPKDTDRDTLPDDEEVAYKTDPLLADTDKDNYPDGEEVNFGWNPLDARVSPGQSYRRSLPDTAYSLPEWIVQLGPEAAKVYDNTTISGGDRTSVEARLNETSYWFLTQGLKFIDQIRIQGLQTHLILPLFGAIFLLGLLHALGPWHSKGFMASYIIGAQVGYARAVLYAGVFTLVHLLDVFILILASKYIFELFDPSKYLTLISQIAAITLVLIALVIGGIALRWLFRKIPVMTATPPASSLRVGLSMAFLSGLAPCTFAWSLLLVLFAIGRMDLALPLVGVFGLWVFATLAGVAIVVTYCQLRLTQEYTHFAKYAQFASALCLLILASILTVQVF